MDYLHWIERERRIRLKLLLQSQEIADKGLFRICRNCDEVCLCHETGCPNCGGLTIGELSVPRDEIVCGWRIRCHLRFKLIEDKEN